MLSNSVSADTFLGYAFVGGWFLFDGSGVELRNSGGLVLIETPGMISFYLVNGVWFCCVIALIGDVAVTAKHPR